MSDSDSNRSSKTIEDLRARLFDAIDGVKAGTMPLETARVIGDLSQTIVNTAKVECEYLRLVDDVDKPASAFLQGSKDDEQTPLPNGITGIVRHRLAG
jgi:hypothetical protein